MGDTNFNFDDSAISIPSSTIVRCDDKIIMVFPSGEREELDIKIEADFENIKPEHQELFLQSFVSRYNHHTTIWNTHTNYDGSKVPTVVGKTVEEVPFWTKIKKFFSL
jgi:hypothetical protein